MADLFDKDIREFIKKKFSNKIFVDEVNVGKARIDLLDLTDELHGIEIKSDHDNYTRLKNQEKNYNRFLSRITIVVGQNHVDSVKSVVPDFWGIAVVYKCPAGSLMFEKIRDSYPNPYYDKSYAISSLWKKELVELVNEKFATDKNKSRYTKMRRWKLASIIQKELSTKDSIRVIRNCYLNRLKEGWRD